MDGGGLPLLVARKDTYMESRLNEESSRETVSWLILPVSYIRIGRLPAEQK